MKTFSPSSSVLLLSLLLLGKLTAQSSDATATAPVPEIGGTEISFGLSPVTLLKQSVSFDFFEATGASGYIAFSEYPRLESSQSVLRYVEVQPNSEAAGNARVNPSQTVTIDSSTPTWSCGNEGRQVTVSYFTTGSFSNVNFTVKLVQVSTGCSGSVSSNITTKSTSTGSALLTWPYNLPATSVSGCPATAVSYKIVVENQGDNAIRAEYPISIYLPAIPAITGVSPAFVTESGQSVNLTSAPDASVDKSWYAHDETGYWWAGTSLGLAGENISINPATSTYYSVVATDAHGCFRRSDRVRVPFSVTISGTGSPADQRFAEGRGVHLDVNSIVAGEPYHVPQYYVPSGADAGTNVYSTVFDTSFPTYWNGYFIVRRNEHWEIYYGFKPTYSYVQYVRLYHTKMAFPTVSSGNREALKSAASVTGTRPPLSALWIKDDDNTEVTLSLTGVSEDYEGGTLPVSLTYFKAGATPEKQVELNWETVSETNSAQFTIERSVNGREFEGIGVVKAAGNSAEKLAYGFVDESPVSGTSYYRLKQTDRDGTQTHYKVVSVRIDGIVVLYPNPSEGRLVTLSAAQVNAVRLSDLTGRSIPFTEVKKGSTVLIAPQRVLIAGIYLLEVNGEILKWVVR